MALYNNGFPATYTPYYAPLQVQQQNNPAAQQMPAQGSLIWVQGEAAAKSYLVAPNNTVQLWDSEAQVIYLKSADASGLPSMKVLDYTIRETGRNGSNSAPDDANNKLSNYATKEEIRAISERINAIRKRLDNLTGKEREESVDE